MFNDNDRFSIKPQSARNRKQIWLCGVGAILAVVVKMWLFAGVLALCAGANVWLYFRNKKKELEARKAKGYMDDDDDEYEGGFDEDGSALYTAKERKKAPAVNPVSHMSRKERKAKYKQFVADIEDELGDFDDDDDEDYDGGND